MVSGLDGNVYDIINNEIDQYLHLIIMFDMLTKVILMMVIKCI